MATLTRQRVATSRLTQAVVQAGTPGGDTLVLVHGNFSSSVYWEDLLERLPQGMHGVAPDLRGYGDTDDVAIDATRGFRDFAEDLSALHDALGLPAAHHVGWSMGAGAIQQLLLDAPGKVASLTLVCPVSPFGFGGTRGPEGTPCFPDFAGSGAGSVNPDFVQRIQRQDLSAEAPTSPRNIINTFYYRPGFRHPREEDFLRAALKERTGPERYPGDAVPSPHWPGTAPGRFGPINAASGKYGNTSAFARSTVKPPVLWVRGAVDQIVSDASLFDLGTLGKLGLVPGWPGEDVFPPQPMLAQTRAVLEAYQAGGGRYRELVLDAGHSPHLERPEEFLAALLDHVKGAAVSRP